MEHAATEFAKWLRARRKAHGVVMRVFAGRIGLAPAEYAEVEAGIVHWLKKEHEKLAVETLSLDAGEAAVFARLLAAARKAPALRFEDVYTRERLEPMRTRSNGRPLSEAGKDALLNAVFKPLA